jgi:hypothetical protein
VTGEEARQAVVDALIHASERELHWLLVSDRKLFAPGTASQWLQPLEVFGGGRDAVVPVLSGGVGRGVQVALDGTDLVVSGRWLYASGVEVADWLCVMVPVPDGNGPPRQVLAAVPRERFEVDQGSWQVASMRGTGSKDVLLHGTVHLTHEQVARMTGTSRVTVTRVLNRLRSRGQLLMRGQRMVIPHDAPAVAPEGWPSTRAEASNTR